MNPGSELRRLLADRLVVAAGAYDCISARAIEEAGFDAIYTSGFGFAAAFLGQPDLGLYTMTENLALVRPMVAAVGIPVLADVDTGYGGPLNVARTVREFEAAGCAGVVLEDQEEPKRCPLIGEGWRVAPRDEALAKLHAALDARRSGEFLVLARTDARGEEAMDRAAAYLEAGADLALPIAKSFGTREQLAAFARRTDGRAAVNLVGWLLEECTLPDLSAMGFRLANFPLVPLTVATRALRAALPLLRARGSGPDRVLKEMRVEDVEDFVGFKAAQEQATRYSEIGRLHPGRQVP